MRRKRPTWKKADISAFLCSAPRRVEKCNRTDATLSSYYSTLAKPSSKRVHTKQQFLDGLRAIGMYKYYRSRIVLAKWPELSKIVDMYYIFRWLGYKSFYKSLMNQAFVVIKSYFRTIRRFHGKIDYKHLSSQVRCGLNKVFGPWLFAATVLRDSAFHTGALFSLTSTPCGKTEYPTMFGYSIKQIASVRTDALINL